MRWSSHNSTFLVEISSASRLGYLLHSFPIPPVVVKTSGVNVPCSTSITLSPYRGFFSFSCNIRRSGVVQDLDTSLHLGDIP